MEYTSLIEANKYIKSKRKITREGDLYHVHPEVGWMNDPNGFIKFKNKYYLCYQYNPYSISWDKMHWGMQEGFDLVNFKDEKVVLAPSEEYDSFKGCFSGSTFIMDEDLYCIYTGVSDNDVQKQILARYSEKEKRFEKLGIVLELDKNVRENDVKNFRDPKVFKKGDYYYVLVGTRNNLTSERQINIYRTLDFKDIEFLNILYKDKNCIDGIFECPDLVKISFNKYVLLGSSMNFYPEPKEDKFQNVHSCIYKIGKFDAKKGLFIPDKEYENEYGELDYGTSFYAVTSMYNSKYIIGWKHMWNREVKPYFNSYRGSLTLVRKLSYKKGKLYQKVTKDISEYLKLIVKDNNFVLDKNLCQQLSQVRLQSNLISFTIDMSNQDNFEFLITDKDDESIFCRFSYDKEKHLFSFDRSNFGNKIYSIGDVEKNINVRNCSINLIKNKFLKIDLYLDSESFELFLNDGEKVLSSNFYKMNINSNKLIFKESNIKIKRLKIYSIELD